MRANRPRLQRIDDLRAVAAAMVFVCHAGLLWLDAQHHALPRWLYYLGRLGVAVFFVVSGLVIYRPFVAARRLGATSDLWSYAVRRVVRIVPAYWLALAVLSLVLPLQMAALGLTHHTGRYAGFAQIYAPGSYHGGLPVAWTLDIELCFYIAAPIIALGVAPLLARAGVRRAEAWLLAGLALASIAVRSWSPGGTLGGTIVGYMGWFVLGMSLACIAEDARARAAIARVRAPAAWLFAGAAYAALVSHLRMVNLPDQGTLADYVGLGLIATLIVAPALADVRPATRVGKWLGDRSYGVYLYHFPILLWLGEKHLNVWLYASAGASLTVLAAALSFHFVERPLMARATTLHRGRRAGDARPAFGTGELHRGRALATAAADAHSPLNA